MPAYASSQFMAHVDEYLARPGATGTSASGATRRIPGGDWRMHIEISEALRDRFPDMTLMLDPAGVDYSMTEAVKVGRRLERLDFHWFEEPFYDPFVGKYAELAATLDISIAATEAILRRPGRRGRVHPGGRRRHRARRCRLEVGRHRDAQDHAPRRGVRDELRAAHQR